MNSARSAVQARGAGQGCWTVENHVTFSLLETKIILPAVHTASVWDTPGPMALGTASCGPSHLTPGDVQTADRGLFLDAPRQEGGAEGQARPGPLSLGPWTGAGAGA